MSGKLLGTNDKANEYNYYKNTTIISLFNILNYELTILIISYQCFLIKCNHIITLSFISNPPYFFGKFILS